MDIDPLQALVLGQLQQGEQVLQMGVDAAVGQQAHQVQGSPLLLAGVHGVVIGGIGGKVAVGDGLGDAGQVLKYHAAGADVGVTHLAVAHLPVGQAHVQSGRRQLRMGEFLEELVQPGRFGGPHRIAGRVTVRHAEAVHNN